jgi:hypothetical protein
VKSIEISTEFLRKEIAEAELLYMDPETDPALLRDRDSYWTVSTVSNGMDAPDRNGIECARVEGVRPTTT